MTKFAFELGQRVRIISTDQEGTVKARYPKLMPESAEQEENWYLVVVPQELTVQVREDNLEKITEQKLLS